MEVASRSGSTDAGPPASAGAEATDSTTQDLLTHGAKNPRQRSVLSARIGAYVALTKPRIIELLLITTIPAMFAAQREVPALTLVLATLVGGTLAAGSANALNCVVDADIDALMRRTRSRPLARHTVTPRAALIFGVILGILAAVELWLTTTWQASVLAVVAILFYVFVYSMWLKRRTSQNIVWGGLAGCMPVIIGWSAVTGTIGWPAWVFFGVIFFWTPPHTWALAMRYREDYKAAGVPMLPVVATEREVVRQIVLYSWAMVACSLLLVPASSWIYAAVAVPFGLWFLAMAHLLHMRVLRGAAAKPMTLFHISNLYLTGISVAWAVDSVIGLPVLGVAVVTDSTVANSDAPGAGLTGSDAAQVGRLRDFLAGHAGKGVAVINYLGRVGARIVVVADDGAFGDAVASSVASATEICSQAGIPVADGWNRELSAKITPSPEDRQRMAGTGR